MVLVVILFILLTFGKHQPKRFFSVFNGITSYELNYHFNYWFNKRKSISKKTNTAIFLKLGPFHKTSFAATLLSTMSWICLNWSGFTLWSLCSLII